MFQVTDVVGARDLEGKVAMFRRCLLIGTVLVPLVGILGWWSLCPHNQTNLVYGMGGDIPLKLDLDYPPTWRWSYPTIVIIPPDGKWHHELKNDPPLRLALRNFASAGFLVCTIHYRTQDQSKFPGPIEDCKAAIRWLRANAERYRIDPDRIGVAGLSLGGYLACMVGTTDSSDGLEGTGGNPEYSSRVQAVVSLAAPVNLTTKTWNDLIETSVLQPFLGDTYQANPQLYRKASPGTYATPDDPPFLVFHSVEDTIIPPSHARSLVEKLQQARVQARLISITGSAHVWEGPKMKRTAAEALAFFTEHLSGAQ